MHAIARWMFLTSERIAVNSTPKPTLWNPCEALTRSPGLNEWKCINWSWPVKMETWFATETEPRVCFLQKRFQVPEAWVVWPSVTLTTSGNEKLEKFPFGVLTLSCGWSKWDPSWPSLGLPPLHALIQTLENGNGHSCLGTWEVEGKRWRKTW